MLTLSIVVDCWKVEARNFAKEWNGLMYTMLMKKPLALHVATESTSESVRNFRIIHFSKFGRLLFRISDFLQLCSCFESQTHSHLLYTKVCSSYKHLYTPDMRRRCYINLTTIEDTFFATRKQLQRIDQSVDLHVRRKLEAVKPENALKIISANVRAM